MKTSFASRLFRKLAKRAGVELVVEPTGWAGQVTFPDGTRRYFRSSNFDINTLGASEVAKDKDYANFFMAKMGYPTITGRAFCTASWAKATKSKNDPRAAYKYTRKLGFPVVVKPNSLSQGVGVHFVHNRAEFLRAVQHVSKIDRVFLVQRVVQGRDYRIVVLEDQVISAYERRALEVVGDGKSSIRKLLEKKQRRFNREGRDTIIKINDSRISLKLKHQRMNRSTVLPAGETLQLLDNRNLSSGGEPVDVTNDMDPSFRALAIKLTHDMGLRYCGVDLMVFGDISEPVSKYWVIEVNSAPGIDNYASSGKEQARIVDDLYVRVIQAMK